MPRNSDGTSEKLIVFLSYSRSDLTFTDRLVAALDSRGFDCRIDRRHLEYGQKWQAMLADFIAEADTVIFVVSPRSIKSKWCRWELAQVAEQAKRVVPVVVEPIAPEPLPPEIGDWHVMPFGPDVDFETETAKLVDVLTSDRDWLKEHTRLAGLAATWDRAERRADALIHGQSLAAAERWKNTPRKLNLKPSALLEDFLSESRAEETRRARLRTRIATAAALVAITLAGLAVYQGLIARREQERAEAQLREAQIQQSRRLVANAKAATDVHDYATAALLAMEALPDEKRVNTADARRPVVGSTRLALNQPLGANKERFVLGKHDAPLISATYNSEGTHVLTLSDDGVGHVWDAKSGRHLFKLDGEEMISLAQFAGGRIVTGSSEGVVRIRELGGSVAMTFNGHQGKVSSVAVSKDGTRLVSAAEGDSVRLWDVTAGRMIAILEKNAGFLEAAFLSPMGNRVLTRSLSGFRLVDTANGRDVALYETAADALFSPDGTHFALFSGGGGRLITGESGAEVFSFGDHTGGIASAAFSPDGRQLVMVSNDQTVSIWSLEDRLKRATVKTDDWLTYEDSTTPVEAATFSADGGFVLLRSSDGQAGVWNAETGDVVAALNRPEKDIADARFGSDRHTVFTSHRDGTIRRWNANSGVQIEVFSGHRGGISSFALMAGGAQILSASQDGTARVWNAEGRRESMTFGRPPVSVTHAAFSGDGSLIATASTDMAARLLDVATGREMAVFKGHSNELARVEFTADGTRLLTMSNKAEGYDYSARVWDIASQKELSKLNLQGNWKHYDFSRDGMRLVTTYLDTASVWDFVTGKDVAVVRPQNGYITSAALDAAGKRLVTALTDSTIQMWNADTGEHTAILYKDEVGVDIATFSPDGSQLLTVGSQVRIRHMRSPEKVVTLPIGDQVSAASFSSDGEFVVTASVDVNLWRAADGEKVAIIEGAGFDATTVHLSPDGTRVLTVSDGMARLWRAYPTLQSMVDAAKSAIPRCLTESQRSENFLDPEVPDWCYDLNKWPYRPRRFGFVGKDITEKDAAQMGLADVAGVVISRVIETLPAEAAGLLKDDIVLAVGGQPAVAKTLRDLETTSSDAPISLTLLRSGRQFQMTMAPRK